MSHYFNTNNFYSPPPTERNLYLPPFCLLGKMFLGGSSSFSALPPSCSRGFPPALGTEAVSCSRRVTRAKCSVGPPGARPVGGPCPVPSCHQRLLLLASVDTSIKTSAFPPASRESLLCTLTSRLQACVPRHSTSAPRPPQRAADCSLHQGPCQGPPQLPPRSCCPTQQGGRDEHSSPLPSGPSERVLKGRDRKEGPVPFCPPTFSCFAFKICLLLGR